MKKTALITGVYGQDGSYLSKLLLDKGYSVTGCARYISKRDTSNHDFVGIKGHKDLQIIELDIADQYSVFKVIFEGQYDEVYNLAANSFVPSSKDSPEDVFRVNALGVFNLLRAIQLFSKNSRFYQASTSEMFGNAEMPELGYDEQSRMIPESLYGSTKLFAHSMVNNFRDDIFAVSGILFNHESPIRGERFLTRKVTKWIGQYCRNKSIAPLELGNSYPERDWGFSGDYVEAMWLMLQQDDPEDFVIATNQAYSVRDFVEQALISADIIPWVHDDCIVDGVERKTIINFQQSGFVRNYEVDRLKGNASKAKEKLGWTPKHDLRMLIEMMIQKDLKEA
jgi:GDPmannose 4,6-dehydratase